MLGDHKLLPDTLVKLKHASALISIKLLHINNPEGVLYIKEKASQVSLAFAAEFVMFCSLRAIKTEKSLSVARMLLQDDFCCNLCKLLRKGTFV